MAVIDPYQLIESAQGWLFETTILPALHAIGLSAFADEVYDATGTSLLGLAVIVFCYLLMRPLEYWLPVERWASRKPLRVDVLYTFLEKSGMLSLAFFLLLFPLWYPLEVQLHASGMIPWHLEDVIPVLHTSPLAAFLFYALVLDFFEYWRHRLQHRLDWWWGLHSIHHSQEQMSFWCESRNHLLDSLIQVAWFTVVALAIGVPGNQFVGIVVLVQLVEAMSHVNARISYGWLGERMLVSPSFHRVHHGKGVGHEGPARGCNFSVLFPLWDIVFGTARFDLAPGATGIRDQSHGAYYGEGFWEQQRTGFRRMLGLAVRAQGARS